MEDTEGENFKFQTLNFNQDRLNKEIIAISLSAFICVHPRPRLNYFQLAADERRFNATAFEK